MMEIVDFLKDSESYPHETNADIKHLETHISHVYLCGDYAYKMKKSLDLGFLDFTSLEKRKFYCEEELRLNSIFAPELYLEVVPIYEKDGQFSFQQKGRVVEYVLKMKEFEQEQILSRIVERGDFTAELFTELAQKLARLHQKGVSSEEINSFASVGNIRKIALQNFAQTDKYKGKCISEKSFERIQKFTLNFINEHKVLFDARRQSGKIRECHGDLHLNNICLYKGEILFFDRIEFNEEFRNIDVVYDLAFLVMDLHFRKQFSLATRVINEYFEQSGDYEGAALLNFYAGMRAYIRGKVISFRSDNSEITDQEKDENRAEARAYFDLAESYATDQKAKLWITSGLSGSGKSTVARRIAAEKQFLIIRSDALRKHLTGVPLYEKGPEQIYNSEISQATYNKMIELADFLSSFGISVILDARFDNRKMRSKAMNLAEKKQLDFKIVYCQADPQVLKRRLDQRSGDVSDADASLIDQQIETFEDFSREENGYLFDLLVDV
ncbi:AAA family ATPase [Cryomorphaceae bacterium 1068]|nr:AAA family ATPase [Cryomorphaceae bacterium 1068]